VTCAKISVKSNLQTHCHSLLPPSSALPPPSSVLRLIKTSSSQGHVYQWVNAVPVSYVHIYSVICVHLSWSRTSLWLMHEPQHQYYDPRSKSLHMPLPGWALIHPHTAPSSKPHAQKLLILTQTGIKPKTENSIWRLTIASELAIYSLITLVSTMRPHYNPQ
jgi:hypothetical protein